MFIFESQAFQFFYFFPIFTFNNRMVKHAIITTEKDHGFLDNVFYASNGNSDFQYKMCHVRFTRVLWTAMSDLEWMRHLCASLMNLNRAQIRQKPVSIEHRLKSWNIEYNFKWNQPYLSRVSNLSRSSNSLNSASVPFTLFT